MTRRFFLILALIILAAVLRFQFFNSEEILAGTGDNLSGYAWSENTGWVSFNCTNTSSCSTADYGVKVAADGLMSGYAWAENIGWVSFKGADLAGCPSGVCEARMNQETGQVSGWARACAGSSAGDCTAGARSDGWDGWISLRGTSYGVAPVGCKWDGYAWGGDVVGWIKFKGSDYGVVGRGYACRPEPPSVSTSAPQPPGDYCAYPLGWTLSWTFSDPNEELQSAYQVVITDASDGSTVKDSGRVSSASGSYAPPAGSLAFGKTYNWQVTVWDPTNLSASATGAGFTTMAHSAPSAVIDMFPPMRPAIDEQVTLKSVSTFGEGAAEKSVAWTITPDSDMTILAGGLDTPQMVIKFSTSGGRNIALTVTDTDDLVCSTTLNISAGRTIPRLKEIKPN